MLKADMTELETKVDTNKSNFDNLVQDAPEDLDTLKEISDNLDFESFLDSLNGAKPASGPMKSSGIPGALKKLTPTD